MHPLVESLYDAARGASLRAVVYGMTIPLRAARLLAAHRTLWALAVVPALLHGVLLVGAVVLILTQADAALAWFWAPPPGNTLYGVGLLGLWYVVYTVVVAAGLVVAYAATALVSGVVASPFNDALAARAEAVLHPERAPAAGSGRSAWREALYSLRSTLLVLALYLAALVPVVLLNVVPGWGSVAAAALGTAVSAFFLALEFADITLARYGYRLRQKLRLLRAHPGLTAGFGLSTSLLLWIPGLNLLCVPVSVVGGTALALALIEDAEPPPVRPG